MTEKTYIVEGRQFRTEADYNRAVHDKEIIDKLRGELKGRKRSELERVKADIHSGKFRFMTLLGQDFEDELDDLIRNAGNGNSRSVKSAKNTIGRVNKTKSTAGAKSITSGKTGQRAVAGNKVTKKTSNSARVELDAVVKEELLKREKKREILVRVCTLLAVLCLGYFCVYSYYIFRTNSSYNSLNELKNQQTAQTGNEEPVIHYTTDDGVVEKEVLAEYKNLLNKNKKLIGWVKIDDTNIDYPVMQTSDNEYYLDHNLNQEYDKNGSIFMDKDCDVLKPSTNLILYGHHMKSGQMFGNLDEYEKKSYYEKHPTIQFDTIYEKGTYQVMYVFRSRVYSEEEIVFKYYQFIDALSEQEFDSNMQEMAKMSLYDTGVTAQYGDRLLTLSTCDYQEKNGRFVVVAKKVA